jgi:hypothetical protein
VRPVEGGTFLAEEEATSLWYRSLPPRRTARKPRPERPEVKIIDI